MGGFRGRLQATAESLAGTSLNDRLCARFPSAPGDEVEALIRVADSNEDNVAKVLVKNGCDCNPNRVRMRPPGILQNLGRFSREPGHSHTRLQHVV